MSRLRRIVARAGSDAEELLERLRRRRNPGPVQICAYRGMGTPAGLSLSGRVLEDRGIQPAVDDQTRLRNLRDNWRRFGTREQTGVLVRAAFKGQTTQARTDAEGYFRLRIEPIPSLDSTLWQTVSLELPDLGVQTTGEVLVPPPAARYAVISDIDDTILLSHATDTLKLLRLTFLQNARTRLPYAGVAALYQAFAAGVSGVEHNPIFYVSSSPWNLYDFLIEFMAFHGLPAGPLFLTDYGLDREQLIKPQHTEHKLAQIEWIAATYPHLALVLIGDSGQHDPEIYLTVARTYPGRVVAIYIRHVSDRRRADEVAALATQAAALGIPLLLTTTSATVAADALRRGLIAAASDRGQR
ncbi:MAG: phosphatase domain-containing protein [Chloroflexales bacterium]